jgi:type I restriction enzyme S subunit
MANAQLPASWEVRTLGEVCDVNPSRKEVSYIPDDVDVSFVPMAAVSEDGRLVEAKTRTAREVKKGFPHFKERDVLLAKITPCFENGKRWLASSLVNGVGFGSTEFHVLRAGDKVLPEWIYYFVSLPQFRISGQRRMTGTAGQKRVPASFLQDCEIPVPSLIVQEELVRVLRKAERLTETRDQINQFMGKIIQSVFLNTFGDPVVNPMKWPVKTIGEVTIYHQQGFYTKQEYGAAGTPLIRISDITEAGDILYGKMPLLDLPEKDIERFQPAIGDLLIARSGVSLGKCAVFGRENFTCVFGAYLIRFRFDQQVVLPDYVQAFLTSSPVLSDLRVGISHKSAQPDVNAREIKRMKIPIPPVSVQQLFVRQLRRIKGLSGVQAESSDSINELFHSLMHKAFRGELSSGS